MQCGFFVPASVMGVVSTVAMKWRGRTKEVRIFEWLVDDD